VIAVNSTVRIDVATERPYPVLVGRGVRAELAGTVTGPSRVEITLPGGER